MITAAPSQEDLRDLYRELILDHARNPRNFGKLPEPFRLAEGINPLCGDKLKVYLQLEDDGQITAASFEGSGCAISVASASLLTETVVGLTKDEAKGFFSAVINSLTGAEGIRNFDLGKLAALQGVREFPARVKCATLAWHALNAAIHDDQQPATTE